MPYPSKNSVNSIPEVLLGMSCPSIWYIHNTPWILHLYSSTTHEGRWKPRCFSNKFLSNSYNYMVKQGLSVIPCQFAHHLQSNKPSDNTGWTAFISSMVIWCTVKPFQVIKLLFHFYSCWESALPFYSKLIFLHSIHCHWVSLKGLPVLSFMHTAFLKLIISCK